MKEMNQDH